MENKTEIKGYTTAKKRDTHVVISVIGENPKQRKETADELKKAIQMKNRHTKFKQGEDCCIGYSICF